MGKYTLHMDRDRLAEARKRTCDYYMGRPVDRIPFQFLVDTPNVKKYDFKVLNEDFSACFRIRTTRPILNIPSWARR